MMLESARRFEKTIKSGKSNLIKSSSGSSGANDVKWNDLKKVEIFVEEVHAATLSLVLVIF